MKHCPLCRGRIVITGEGPEQVATCKQCKASWTLDGKTNVTDKRLIDEDQTMDAFRPCEYGNKNCEEHECANCGYFLNGIVRGPKSPLDSLVRPRCSN